VELNCKLAPLVYADLYELLASDDTLRPRVEERLETLGREPSWLDEAARAYRASWEMEVQQAGNDPSQVLLVPLKEAQLATWIMAPLRATGASATFSAELSKRVAKGARQGFATMGRLPQEYRCTVIAWTLGRLCGDVDNSAPVVPADFPADPHVAEAYVGLLEHVCGLDPNLDPWPEMVGSSILWRVAGIAQGLWPLPQPNLRSSLDWLMRGARLVMPSGFHAELTEDWHEFVAVRNGFTHVAKTLDGYGFAEVVGRMRSADEVRNYLRATTYFVCDSVSKQFADSEDYRHFEPVLVNPIGELAWWL
jgi:hypothetical protein